MLVKVEILGVEETGSIYHNSFNGIIKKENSREFDIANVDLY